MAEVFGRDVGGIKRLRDLIRRHGDELEADLLDTGDRTLRLRNCPSEDFTWRDLRIFVKFVGVRSNLYRKLFPESADWDLRNQLLAAIIDTMHDQWWLRCGGEDSGYPRPDPLPRPGVGKRKGDHRRGNATRSETNKALGMRLDNESDPNREAKIRNLFRGPNKGPVRDISKGGVR